MKRLKFLCIAAVVLLSSCQHNAQIAENHQAVMLRKDGLGRMVQFPAKPTRILSLAPSLTEMLGFLVVDSHLIAVSSHCNYPAEMVERKKRINIYPLDIESIISLKPQIAFSEEGMISPENIRQLENLGIPVYLFKYRTCQDIVSGLDSLRLWLHCIPGATEKVDSLRNELARFEADQARFPEDERPKVLAITYHDPIFAFGFETWMTDKIRLAGGKNVLQDVLDKPYPVLSRESVLKFNPDVLFGGNFQRMDSVFFRQYPELRQINAWKKKRVFRLDDDLASRPGPRFPDAIKEMQIFLKKK